MTPFQKEVSVRFGDCDPAGIVYYPRYFDMINQVVEDWFEDGLDASFPGLMHHKRLATPTAHFNVDFQNPSHFGDRLTFKVVVEKVGKTSVNVRMDVSCQYEIRMVVKQVLVFINIDSREATEIPHDVAKRLERYLVEDGAKGEQASATQ